MKKRIAKLYILTIIVIILFILTAWNCGRKEPTTAAPAPPVSSEMKPETFYSLTVSEPSGLVYNKHTNTLLTVSDSRPDIYEISLTGSTHGTIPANGTDMEGVALSVTGDTLYFAEERIRKVSAINRSGSLLRSFTINAGSPGNSGLEGITVNTATGHLYIINEKDPVMLFCYNDTTELWRKPLSFTSDISGICYDETTGALWIVSDESRKVLKLTLTGELIASWNIPFSKGEGIAIAGDKIYIVNDQENRMYLFSKPVN